MNDVELRIAELSVLMAMLDDGDEYKKTAAEVRAMLCLEKLTIAQENALLNAIEGAEERLGRSIR